MRVKRRGTVHTTGKVEKQAAGREARHSSHTYNRLKGRYHESDEERRLPTPQAR
jgi:hypothetical protein